MIQMQHHRGNEFQSHLYGIESTSRRNPASLPRCFNRTFMELKVFRAKRNLKKCLFQSHLYGIESVVSFLISPVSLCFNRTFMELKVGWIRCDIQRARFQSHLYGIERDMNQGRTQRCLVSIAPLWNWKNKKRLVLQLRPRFNRTFMELKAWCCKTFPLWPSVSIAPLWNWKSFGYVFCISGLMFQSHLYGIESMASDPTVRGFNVSIAPLWNWKQTRSIASICAVGFNRTFMELKEAN